jgi:SAM-dependent methyltransferase
VSEPGKYFTDGKAYERTMGRWSRLVGEKFIDWLDVPAGLRWIDVGCGNGAFTEVLVARCAPAEIAGIDPSEGQIAYARARKEAGNATFRIGDAQALPFGDRSFDAATMALVISFVPDAAKAASEMARVVRPGGLVATYMWDIPGGGLPVEPSFVALKSLGIHPPFPPGSEVSRLENLKALWTQAGLVSVEATVIRIPVTHSSFDDLWESNSGATGPAGKTISELPPDAREQLKNRMREKVPIQPDGCVVLEARANAVRGRVPG